MSSEMTISQTAELSTEERSERARKAFILIEQVRVAGYTTAMALKQLRDDKVHELLSYEDFEEFCDNELPFLKPKQISKYLQIADTFGDRLSVKEMLAKRGGMTALLEVAEEIKVKGIEPSSLSDEDIEDIILRQKKSIKKLEKEKESKDKIINMKDAELRRKAEMLQTIEEDYKSKFDALSKGQPLPEKNRETKQLIMELMTTVNQISSELIEIPAEERDAELTNQTAMAIGLLRRVANQLSDDWNNDLHDMEFQSSESQRDPKFDDDLKALAAEED